MAVGGSGCGGRGDCRRVAPVTNVHFVVHLVLTVPHHGCTVMARAGDGAAHNRHRRKDNERRNALSL